jgi:hypothetical protein
MGSWKEGLYKHKSTISFLEKNTDFLIKEAFYLFAPELVQSNTRWLKDVLTVIEMMLIFSDENHFGFPLYLRRLHTAVRRWQEVFFHVWDAEWDGNERIISNAPYSKYAYRVEQRQTMNALFERLIELADLWREENPRRDSQIIVPTDLRQSEHPQRDLQPFSLQEKLPIFSITHLKTEVNTDYFLVGLSFYTLIDMLIQWIVYEAYREEDVLDEFEDTWLAVDVIGVLCEKYQVPAGLNKQTVQGWLDTITKVWIEAYDGSAEVSDLQTLIEKDGDYRNVVKAFDRLMKNADQYPRSMI